MPVELQPDDPPICPKCSKPVFRPGHMAALTAMLEGSDEDWTCTVCMHCVAIWKLSVVDGRPALNVLNDVERAAAEPLLALVRAKSRANAREAAALGMTIDEYHAFVDSVRASAGLPRAN